MKYDPLEYLRRLGEAGQEPFDIARAALMLAALDHPKVPLEPYLAHLREMEDAMAVEQGQIRHVNDAAGTVANLLFGRHGYAGDRLEYDNPRNADLISVIDRRRGLPVALGILYLHAARAARLRACGLNAQSHFVLRLTHGREDAIVDPFNAGAIVDPADLPAELRADDAGLVQPVGDIDVLLRLENNLKIRALKAGDSLRAIELTRRMVLIAPRRPDLWFDLARLNEAGGVLGAARKAYEMCLELARPGEELHNEAAISAAQLNRRLN